LIRDEDARGVCLVGVQYQNIGLSRGNAQSGVTASGQKVL